MHAPAVATSLLLVLPLTLLALFGALLAAIHVFGQRERRVGAEVAVVLGARVHSDGSPSTALKWRVRKAVELWRRGKVKRLLLAGGSAANLPAEASVMRSLAIDAGVPSDCLWLEPRSRSTLQNARECAALLRSSHVNAVVLVTDSYHCFRAAWLFRREGIDVQVAPSILGFQTMTPLQRLYWLGREGVGVVGVLLGRAR